MTAVYAESMGTTRSIRVVLVHGTWGQNAAFLKATSTFQRQLLDRFGDRITIAQFSWSGKNSQRVRLQAARDFAAWMAEAVERDPDAAHIVVAHSHGGNVVLWGLRDRALRTRIAGVVCMGTPFIRSRLRPFWPVASSYGLAAALVVNLLVARVLGWIGGFGPEAQWWLGIFSNLMMASVFMQQVGTGSNVRRQGGFLFAGLSTLAFTMAMMQAGRQSPAMDAFVHSIPGALVVGALTIAKVGFFTLLLLIAPWSWCFDAVQTRAERLCGQFAREYPPFILSGLRLLSVPVQGDEPLLILTTLTWLATVPMVITHWSVVIGLLVAQTGMGVYDGSRASSAFLSNLGSGFGLDGLLLAIAASALYGILGFSLVGAMIGILYPFAMTWYCLTRQLPFAFGVERPSLSLIGKVACRQTPDGVEDAAEFESLRFSLRSAFGSKDVKAIWSIRHSWMYAHPRAIEAIANWVEKVAAADPTPESGSDQVTPGVPLADSAPTTLDRVLWGLLVVVAAVWVAMWFWPEPQAGLRL